MTDSWHLDALTDDAFERHRRDVIAEHIRRQREHRRTNNDHSHTPPGA